jgi:hypothetical protein
MKKQQNGLSISSERSDWPTIAIHVFPVAPEHHISTLASLAIAAWLNTTIAAWLNTTPLPYELSIPISLSPVGALLSVKVLDGILRLEASLLLLSFFQSP